MRANRSVFQDNPPSIFRCLDTMITTEPDHRLDRDTHALDELHILLIIRRKVWNIGRFVNLMTHTVTDECLNNAITVRLDARFNRAANVFYRVANDCRLNAFVHRRLCYFHEFDSLFTHDANGNRDSHVCAQILVPTTNVKSNNIALNKFTITIAESMNDFLIHAYTNRTGKRCV